MGVEETSAKAFVKRPETYNYSFYITAEVVFAVAAFTRCHLRM